MSLKTKRRRRAKILKKRFPDGVPARGPSLSDFECAQPSQPNDGEKQGLSDATHPQVIARIVSFAPRKTLLVLRSVSRRLRILADKQLATHLKVVMHLGKVEVSTPEGRLPSAMTREGAIRGAGPVYRRCSEFYGQCRPHHLSNTQVDDNATRYWWAVKRIDFVWCRDTFAAAHTVDVHGKASSWCYRTNKHAHLWTVLRPITVPHLRVFPIEREVPICFPFRARTVTYHAPVDDVPQTIGVSNPRRWLHRVTRFPDCTEHLDITLLLNGGKRPHGKLPPSYYSIAYPPLLKTVVVRWQVSGMPPGVRMHPSTVIRVLNKIFRHAPRNVVWKFVGLDSFAILPIPLSHNKPQSNIDTTPEALNSRPWSAPGGKQKQLIAGMIEALWQLRPRNTLEVYQFAIARPELTNFAVLLLNGRA